MDFSISRENKMVRDAIRDWVSKECPRDKVGEWDAADQFPPALTKKLSQLGFCALTVSETHGGEGINLEGACIVAEEIAARFPPLARWYTHQALMGGFLIETLGDDTQKEAFLPACAAGRCLVAPVGIDDPQASLATCRKDASGANRTAYRLQGESPFVNLADQARLLLVPAAAEDQTSPGAVTLFLLAADRPGITVTPVEKIGYRGARYCRVVLDDVVLEPADIFGGGAEAWRQVVDLARLMTAAEALGLARGAFDYTLEHARQRVQFGQAVGKFPALRNRLAEMACDIDAAAMLVARAAWCADHRRSFHREAAAARLKAGDIALRCAMEGLQIFGGYGYTMEYDIQRYVRDAAGMGAAEEAAREGIGHLLGL